MIRQYNQTAARRGDFPALLLDTLILSAAANCWWPFLSRGGFYRWLAAIGLLLIGNLLPLAFARRIPGRRLRICGHGVLCLRVFCRSAILSVVYHIAAAFVLLPGRWTVWVFSALFCIAAEALIFWNGMLCVYGASVQLGIRHRVLGLLCGLVPVANLVMLRRIIRVVSEEVRFETMCIERDRARQSDRICDTKYPILLVHGVFFRDYRLLNYWGRIPAALQRNGARIFYGGHQSAASVADSAAELTERIRKIVSETGCEKVNIIAHSKGGLDCRYAISHCGAAPYIASLTTVNTPHRGCEFADYLLNRLPSAMQMKTAAAYNAAMRRLGDSNPDFMAAVRDLTAGSCTARDSEMPLPQDIFCQSVGSVLIRAAGGKFPLNFTYHLARFFDGPNDGLVSVPSFRWGENHRLLQPPGRRGISHGDMIDLNRENIPGFDVREFYVQLVCDLKKRGL